MTDQRLEKAWQKHCRQRGKESPEMRSDYFAGVLAGRKLQLEEDHDYILGLAEERDEAKQMDTVEGHYLRQAAEQLKERK